MSQGEDDYEDQETSLLPVYIFAGLVGLSIVGSFSLALALNTIYYALLPPIVPLLLLAIYFILVKKRE